MAGNFSVYDLIRSANDVPAWSAAAEDAAGLVVGILDRRLSDELDCPLDPLLARAIAADLLLLLGFELQPQERVRGPIVRPVAAGGNLDCVEASYSLVAASRTLSSLE